MIPRHGRDGRKRPGLIAAPAIAAVGSLLGFLALLFPGVLIGKEILIATEPLAIDIIHLHLPIRIFLASWLRRGIFPLWCPQLYCGFPVQAWGEGSFCHPLSLLPALFLPGPWALSATILLSLTAAGLLMMLYARSIGFSWPATFLSGVSFAASAYCLQEVQQLDHLLTLCWIGLVFYGWEKFFRSGDRRGFLWAGLGWALQILAGYPAFTAYTYMAVCGYVVYDIYARRESHPTRLLRVRRYLQALLLFTAVGLGLSAVQWIPTLEMLPWTVRRGGYAYAQSLYPSYGWRQLFNWLTMSFQGDPWKNPGEVAPGFESFWEGASYIGVLPLFLCLFCVVEGFRRPGKHRFFCVLLMVSLVLALATPLYRIFWVVFPITHFFRGTARFIAFSVFSASLLAGLGLDWFRSRLPREWARWATGFILVLTLADLLVYGRRHYLMMPPSLWLARPQAAWTAGDSLTRVVSYQAYDAALTRLCRQAILGGAPTLGERYKPYLAYKELIGSGLEPTWGLNGAWGLYSEVRGERLKVLQDFSYLSIVGQTVVLLPRIANILRVQAIRFLVTPGPMGGRACRLLKILPNWAGAPPVFLYELARPLPRAFVVGDRVSVSSLDEVMARLLSPGFDPSRTVVLEKESPAGSPAASGSRVEWEKDEPDEIRLKVHMQAGGHLVLSDAFYPGWIVTVDGEKSEILRANANFRAVWLEKGDRSVCFFFKPFSFRVGLAASLISVFVAVAALV